MAIRNNVSPLGGKECIDELGRLTERMADARAFMSNRGISPYLLERFDNARELIEEVADKIFDFVEGA